MKNVKMNPIFAPSLVHKYMLYVTVSLDYYLCWFGNDVWDRKGAPYLFPRYSPLTFRGIVEKNVILWNVDEF
jgi:hypothetical protein